MNNHPLPINTNNYHWRPMTGVTSIQLPKATRDRLRKFGHKGQTWAEILDSLMERVEYEEFMEEQYRRLDERKDFVPLDEV